MRRILIRRLMKTPLEEQELEIVERKGLGHPDYICDAIMDSVSIELNKEYERRFGGILHYNADKSLLVAGETEVRFGGGFVKKPMLFVFGDRATTEFQGVEIPVGEIAIRAAKKWIKENLRFVDPEEHVRYQVELKPGSAELTDIFRRGERVLGANDTSAAVGYAPLSRTEKAVLEIERFLNSKEFKRSYPETGEDVKVMGLRVKDELDVTIAMAFVDRYIDSEGEYFKRKAEVKEEVCQFLRSNFDFKNVRIEFNTLDVEGRGVSGLYLTVLGTSAESGDSGQVGRGNRVNGIIPLNRPVSSEAAAGKNPVSHVGKIYNILTHKMAERIYREVPGLDEVYVWLLSKIGQRIDEPAMTAVELVMKDDQKLEDIKGQVEEIINSELDRILEFCDELAEGKISLY
ncbi:MAG: methionine adenosyltransferase [Thermoproteota archaeon]|nr:MAG: methionine adenosyltransferase [Candidatus Korarchaeota archaeon]